MTQYRDQLSSSYKDPSGFVFTRKGILYRQVNKSYRQNYNFFLNSGLYKRLVKEKLLIGHKKSNIAGTKDAYKIIRPKIIPYISYPYEWCFSQLQDAALLTLKIQKIAMRYGMSLKDATAYNVQFDEGRPIFIDTLSFEKIKIGQPWVAYKQFCEHFLAPLVIQSYVDLRYHNLSRLFLDGIPLDMASKILPLRAKFNPGIYMHIVLHAKSQKRNAGKKVVNRDLNITDNQLEAIVDNLIAITKSLKLVSQDTVWQDYYHIHNYTDKGFREKKNLIDRWVKLVKPKNVWDVGANDGTFSAITAGKKIYTISTDFDHLAIEKSYQKIKKNRNKYILPLVLDVTNPSPALGWNLHERESFLIRAKFDLTLCLALIHHLAIGYNLPFEYIADFFSQTTKNLVIEFVPKEDSNAKKLFASREDVFTGYDRENFEKVFAKYFYIKQSYNIKQSKRTIYLMENKKSI